MSSTQERRYKLLEKYGLNTQYQSESSNNSGTKVTDTQKKRQALLDKYGIVPVDESYIDSFLSDADSYLNSASEDLRLTGFSSAANNAADRRTAAKNLKSRARLIGGYLEENKDNLDRDYYNSLKNYINNFHVDVQKVADAFEDKADFYGKFESGMDYHEYVNEQYKNEQLERKNALYPTSEAENPLMALAYETVTGGKQFQGANSFLAQKAREEINEAYEEEYEGLSYSDIQRKLNIMPKGTDEYNWLSQYAPNAMTAEDYAKEIGATNDEVQLLESVLAEYKSLVPKQSTANPDSYANARLAEIRKQYGSEAEIEARIEQAKATNWDLTNKSKYNTLSKNEDFYSVSHQLHTPENFLGNPTDSTYAYINDIDGYRMEYDGSRTASGSNSLAIYKHMTKEEINNYNYLYNKEGKKAANEYLDYLQYSLDERAMEAKAQSYADFAHAFPGAASAISFASNPISGLGAVDALGQNIVKNVKETLTGEYAGPINYNSPAFGPSVTTSAIRETVSNDLANKYGVIELDENKNPVLSKILNGKSLGDVYQLGMSMGDSAIVALMAPFVGIDGTYLLSGSAATQGVLSAVEKGATDEQALWMGFLSGAAEFFFERYELEQLLGADTNVLKALANQALTEGFGEGFTTIANTLADVLIMAEKSDLSTAVAEYMQQGLSRDEAMKKALLDASIQIGWDFIGGAVTGSIMGSTSSVIKNVAENKERNYDIGSTILNADSGVDSLKALAMDVAGADSKLAKQAGKVTGETFTGKGLGNVVAEIKNSKNASKVGKLYNAVSTEVSAQNQSDIAKSLEESGFSKKSAKNIANAIVAQINGEDLSNFQARTLESVKDNDVVKGIVSNLVTNDQSTFGQRNQKVYDFAKDVKAGTIAKSTGLSVDAVKKAMSGDVEAVLEDSVNNKYAVSDNGQTILQNADGTAKQITIAKVDKIENKKVYLKLSDGTVVDADDVSFASNGEAYAYSVLAEIGVSANEANDILSFYKGNTDSGIISYARGVQEAYRYGMIGVPVNKLTESSFASQLPGGALEYSYNIGRMHSVQKTGELQNKLKKRVVGKGKYYKKFTQEQNGVHYDDVDITGEKLNAQQKTGIQMAEFLAAIGMEVHVYKSEKINGQYVGDNGTYYGKDGSIHIDLNAGSIGQGYVGYTISHEFTHFIKDWSPVKFNIFADALFKEMGMSGVDVESKVAETLDRVRSMKEYKGKSEEQLWDIAYDEVVAEMCETMLTDTDVAVKIADNIKKTDSDLLNKIIEFFNNLLTKLENVLKINVAYKDVTPDSTIAAQAQETIRSVERLRDLFADAAADAVQSYNTAKENVAEYAEIEISNEEAFENSEYAVLNQIRPPYADGSKAFNAFVDNLDNDARKTFDLFYGFYQKSRITNTMSVTGKRVKAVNISSLYLLAQDWNDMLTKEPKWAAAAKELADFLPADVRKRMNMNEDGTLNPTMLEKEFKMPSSMAQRLVDALPVEAIESTYRMGSKEITLPEGKSRQSVGGEAYRRAIIEETRKIFAEGKLKQVSIGTMSKDRWGSLGFLAANGKTGASGDFTTVCPQMMFNRGCWYCYRRAAMEKGVNNKLVAQSVWYTGEILRIKDSDIAALNKNGGLRIQSFGDWMPHFSAMLADVLYDAEQRGLQVKIITKEPSMINYIAALRDQGVGKNLYFNLSADYTIEKGPAKQGMTVDSLDVVNPERPFMRYDNSFWWKRAMTVEEAAKYREKYPWVNVRIVATTQEEFIRGLKDPKVDVVTGYHGNIREYERVDSTTGEHKVQVEALGDAGMPRFAFNPMSNEWVTEYEGKTSTHKRLAEAIADNNLQMEYYTKTCCITGRCATCQGKCGALARDFNVKNATNRDTESVAYWQQEMQYGIEPEFGDMTEQGEVRHALRENYWYPQMTKTELREIEYIAKNRVYKDKNYVGIGVKFLYNTEKGHEYFALYSTANEKDPTILYACKNSRAKFEHDALKEILERKEHIYELANTDAEVADRLLSSVGDVLSGTGVYNSFTVGTGSNKGNGSIHSGYKGKRLSAAFKNCIKNIIEVQSKYGLDDKYQFAVDIGDMATAQRMVDEAAKKAGYPVKAYHGTPINNITVFDGSKIGTTTDDGIFGHGFYFSTNKLTADGYATVDGKTMPVFLNVGNPWWGNGHKLHDVANELGLSVESLTTRKVGNRSSIVAPLTNYSRTFTSHLKANGYDSVVIQHGSNDYEIVVFDNTKIKSADPVTYDDDGNVIPLSKRFDQTNNDIRYSSRVKVDTTDMDEDAKKIIRKLEIRATGSKYDAGKYASYSPERIEREINNSSSATRMDYAKSYIAWVNPDDFLYATTTSDQVRAKIEEEAGELDLARLRKETQPIHLTVDFETGDIKGHEGRHRLTALSKAGVEKVAVIFDAWNDDRYNTKPISMMKINGQVFDRYHYGHGFYAHDMIPLSKRYADAARQLFSDVSGSVRFSQRTNESVSNRALLANALESAAQEDVEKTKLQEYKAKIAAMDGEEKRLSEINAQIKEISFGKGPRDTEKLSKLRDEKIKIQNRINIYDKQLLRLESTKILKGVLDREKQKAYKRAEAKGQEALEAYKKETDKRIEDFVKKQAEKRKNAVESKNRTELRHKIQNVVKELNDLLLNESKTRHVPDNLKKSVAGALSIVNMDTVGAEERAAKYADLIAKEQSKAEPDQEKIDAYTMTMENILRQGDKIGQRLKELREAYEEIESSADPDIAHAYDPVIANAIKELSQTIGDTSIRDMSIEQLSDVYDVYKMVLTRVRDANKALAENIKESISRLATNVVREVRAAGGEHKMRASMLDPAKKFFWNNMKPVYAMEYIGSSTFTKVFNNVRAGEDVWAVDVTEARSYYLDKAKKYGYNDWDFDKKYKFETASGLAFELTLEQMLSLYAYSKRDQAHDHLRLGGFVFDSNIETTKEKGKVIKYKVNTADAHQITPKILSEIIGKMTSEQIGFVDEMQDYLSTVMGAKGNEVTSKMYGVKLFKEKNYFPLKSASQFMFEQNQVAGEVRIKNSGFTNKVVAKANNPIILSNFMDVWSNHVNDMSMYHAFTLPLEDFNRVFNFESQKQEGVPAQSVKTTLQNAYTPAAVQYVKQLITDLNGGARTDSTTGVINKLMGLFKKGAVFASMSVVIQQPSAIARATALIDTKYFAGPKIDSKRHNALWEEVKKYAPVAIIKEMGYFDSNMGKSTQDFITSREYSGFSEKTKAFFTDSGYRDEALSKAPALADEIAWCGIWEAVKRETKANNKGMDVKSEAFLKKAGERFTEVIVKTQVYDSVLARSANMRSKDTVMKMATAFMAEPTTSINMIADALIQGKRGSKRYARHAIGAVIASQILNSILVSFVYAARDDDEDETYLEKYLGSLAGEIIDGFNPAGYIPFIKDIVSIVQGYEVERSDMAVISDLWNAITGLKSDTISTYRKVENFAGSIAQIFGLPVKNIMRDARSAYQTFFPVKKQKTTAAGIGYAALSSVGKEVKDSEQLYRAYVNGNAEHLVRVLGRYTTKKKANSAMRSAIKEHYLAGDIDADTAIKYMVSYCDDKAEDAYWDVEKWKHESKFAEDFGKYDEFYNAVKTGNNLKEIIKKYTDNGVTEATLKTQITEEFKPLYIEMSTAEKANLKGYLLNALTVLGNTRKEAEDKLKDWEFEAENGFSYNNRKKEYMEGEITREQLEDALVNHGGYSDEEVDEYFDDILFESEYGFAYSSTGKLYQDGQLTRDEAYKIFTTQGEMSAEDANEKLASLDFEMEHGFSYSEKKELFIKGDITARELKQYIMKVEGKTDEEASDMLISYVRDAYDEGDMDKTFAKNTLVSYAGLTAEEADSKLRYIDVKKQFPDTYVDDAWVDEYYKEVESSGISIEVFVDYRNKVKGITGKGKKEGRMAVIDSMPISNAQKDALYYAEGWAKSKLYEAPWH